MARSDPRQRQEMRVWQAHAAFHYAAGLQGAHLNERNCPFPKYPDGDLLNGQEYRNALVEYRARTTELLSQVELKCPMCGIVAKANDDLWEWEHAPQQSGRSIFGAWSMACWTCGPCNHKCGEGFEADVARPTRLAAMAHLGLIDPQPQHYTGRMVVPRTAAQQLTDVKAAFTIAFTVLGHPWVFSPAVEPIRLAIHHEDASYLAGHAHLAVRSTFDTPGVSEAFGPDGFVAVHNGDGPVVILPGIDNTHPPAVHGRTYSIRKLDWPVFPRRGQGAVHGACGAGQLFHRDLCAKEAAALLTSAG
ncbi:hypothetical protein [Glycomyces sp. NPDC047010]|uniref:hypothetical protein n=1 Tax=Glycomyces sp. NPDC047010 TaxID=3155023 RepID=UPI0033E9FDE1